MQGFFCGERKCEKHPRNKQFFIVGGGGDLKLMGGIPPIKALKKKNTADMYFHWFIVTSHLSAKRKSNNWQSFFGRGSSGGPSGGSLPLSLAKLETISIGSIREGNWLSACILTANPHAHAPDWSFVERKAGRGCVNKVIHQHCSHWKVT